MCGVMFSFQSKLDYFSLNSVRNVKETKLNKWEYNVQCVTCCIFRTADVIFLQNRNGLHHSCLKPIAKNKIRASFSLGERKKK